jgi:membrane protease YdiL (CAAX protease family)
MSHSTPSFDARILLLCVVALAAQVTWQIVGGGIAVALIGAGSVLAIYLFLKGVFAAFIVGVTALARRLTATGFGGSVRAGSLVYGLPLIAFSALLALPLAETGLTLSVTAAIGWSLMALFVAIGEEAVFRGILHRTIAPLGYWPTALITSLGFGAIHLLGLFSEMPDQVILAQCVMATAIGFVFFLVRQSAGSLWTVIFLHWLVDSCAFVANGGIAVPDNPDTTAAMMLGVAAAMMIWAIPAMIIQNRRQRSVPAPSLDGAVPA